MSFLRVAPNSPSNASPAMLSTFLFRPSQSVERKPKALGTPLCWGRHAPGAVCKQLHPQDPKPRLLPHPPGAAFHPWGLLHQSKTELGSVGEQDAGAVSEAISSGSAAGRAPRHGAPPRHLLPRSHRNALGGRSEAPEQEARGEKQQGTSSRARRVPAGELSVLSPTVRLRQVPVQPVTPSHELRRGSEPRRRVPQGASPTLLLPPAQQGPGAGSAAAQISSPHPQCAQKISAARVAIQQPGPGTAGPSAELWRASAPSAPSTPATQQELSAPQGKISSALGEDFTQATPIPSYSRASAGWKRHGHEPELPANPAGAWAQTGPDVPSAASKPAPGKEKGSNAAPQQANTPPAPKNRKPGLRAAGSALPQPSPCLQASRSPR